MSMCSQGVGERDFVGHSEEGCVVSVSVKEAVGFCWPQSLRFNLSPSKKVAC